jgi:hypothetical protein
VTTSPDDDATGAGPAPGSESPGIDAGQAADVLRTLANSVALLPQAPTPDEAPEGALALPVIEHEGQRYIPVFTSEESLRAAGADPGTAVSIPVAELAAHWPSDDLWLAVDPASRDGLGLPPDVVRALPALAAPAG